MACCAETPKSSFIHGMAALNDPRTARTQRIPLRASRKSPESNATRGLLNDGSMSKTAEEKKNQKSAHLTCAVLPTSNWCFLSRDAHNDPWRLRSWPDVCTSVCLLCFTSDIVLLIDWLYCIDLFSCIAASLFNKLTLLYLLYFELKYRSQRNASYATKRKTARDGARCLPSCKRILMYAIIIVVVIFIPQIV